jgi:uncharacterized membrane protein YccF (DUF307 family)
MNTGSPPPTVVMVAPETNLLVRVVWFIFVGWWLSQLVVLVSWFFNVTIIGLPLGVYLMNRIPQAATLKSSRKNLTHRVDPTTGALIVELTDRPQRIWWQRALFFLVVGWWFSLLWLEAAWLFGVLILTLPLSFWMFGAAGKVTTLRR